MPVNSIDGHEQFAMDYLEYSRSCAMASLISLRQEPPLPEVLVWSYDTLAYTRSGTRLGSSCQVPR
jgi:hypothetical protein